MHITLTGNLGSGKSTLGKIIEKNNGYEIFSTGKVIRRIAEEHGISVLEMNKLMSEDHKYDHMIDDTSARISRENPDKKILFDSRLAWNFVEKAFKVFLSVSIDEAAARVFADSARGSVEKYASVDEARQKLIARASEEDRRYREIYGIEYFDFTNYNLILDSTDCSPEILAQILIDEAEKYEECIKAGGSDYTKLIFSPDRPETDFAAERAKGETSKEVLHGVEFMVIKIEK